MSWDPGPRPEWVQAANAGAVLPITAEASEPLTRDSLVAEALARNGRAGAGLAALCAPGPGTGDDFVEPLDRALVALAEEAELHLLGRWITRRFLVRLLEARLHIVDHVRADPGVRDEEIVEPLFVVGAPRTGTTILHALLAADHRHRVPLGWELLRPAPPPEAGSHDTDPRIPLADVELRLPQLVTDGIVAIHEYGGRMHKECLSAMSFTFRTEELVSRYHTPSYAAWLLGCDMSPAYEMHRLVLQLLQRRMPTRRWVLKSPVHLHNLGPLLATYPDARLAVTHRDPLAILASVTSLIANLRWSHSDRVDVPGIGRYHAELYHADLDGLASTVTSGGPASAPMVHGRFADFAADGLAVVERMYDELGWSLPPDVADAMAATLAARPRDRHGGHAWSFDDLGLDRDAERARFARYSATFEVPAEVA